MKPILLAPSRFTSLQRTPWAGDRIIKCYKQTIMPQRVGERVGESWEFSCDPELPSLLLNGSSMIDWVREHQTEMFSSTALAKGKQQVEILVKLLDAADVLSLQIHPADDDPHLKANECGKPESWYVLNAEPGAGFYLGFSQKTTKDELRQAFLAEGDKARELLHFVPVKAGDYFEISPGVPHAIGPGVTLLEPQRILEGKSGKTYRFWDWGRKYLPDGSKTNAADKQGKSRELHLEESLRLIDPAVQVGEGYVETLRRSAKREVLESGGVSEWFPGNPHYQVGIFTAATAGAVFHLNRSEGYGALLILAGVVELTNDAGVTFSSAGESFLLPHACFPLQMRVRAAGTKVAFIVPSAATKA